MSGLTASKASAARLRFDARPCPSILAAILATLSSACLSSAPIVPVTPQNQQQVSSCQGIAAFHNGVVIGDFVLSGGATTVAAVGAALPSGQTSAKTDLEIVGAIVGGLGAIGTVVGGYTSTEFANSQCSSVVGSLPVASGGAK